MGDEQFKFPPGITSSVEYRRVIFPGLELHVIETIQRDAVTAARQEAEEAHRLDGIYDL